MFSLGLYSSLWFVYWWTILFVHNKSLKFLYSILLSEANLYMQTIQYVGSLALAVIIRGGVEDTRLEAKAKDTKKIRGQGQGQPFRGQTLSRPRTGMLEAKDQGHSRKCSRKKKVFKKVFQAISNLKA